MNKVLHLNIETSEPGKWLDDITCLRLMHLDGVDTMADDGNTKAVLAVCLEKGAEVKSAIQRLGLTITDECEKDFTAPLELR